MKSIVDNQLSQRFECGYSKPTVQIGLSHKQEIIKALWLHHVFFSPHAEIAQLKKGFRETLQVESLVCSYPHIIWGFLVHSKSFDVTADFLLDSFVINYSLQGNNLRTSEEAIILSWNDYVEESSGNQVSLSDILQFLSGSTKIPACGFDNIPCIHFTNDECFPRVSTCDLTLTLIHS